ncbi:serine/threonine-protein kinase [Mycobacteroides abscessus]|uniref:serine/threonine-protein kinase n=1 Tax=Mycobacteroides abscessus TaxID=36809 RepID=UPI0015FEC1CF|nr:serine/threonine-protein kinase [Mycobacteroides abscessus]
MPQRPFPSGTIVNDRYEFVQKLGSDGDVYEAHDRNLDRRVALKLLHPIAGVSQSWEEAQRLEHLRSRFLVEVINADVVGNSDLRFITTPLLDNGDLENAARHTGLSVHDAVRYMQQVCTGVGRIHAAGMIHRDIKPANVLMGDDGVFVSDLQLCAILDADGRAGRNGSFCTLAPEAAPDDGFCSLPTDIYSLGATAFYLLAGKYPVDHELPKSEQRERIAAGRLRQVRDLAPHVSQALGTVIRKALSIDPSRRHASAEAFANALTQASNRGRNWRRVGHSGHLYCLEGLPIQGRTAIAICSEADGVDVEIRARSVPTNRRISGYRDERVGKTQLVRRIQQLVKALSS